MNKSRELVLQRVSRIGSLTAMDNTSQNTKYKGSHVGARTIEAALGTYMIRDNKVFELRRQDTYTRSYEDSSSDAQDQRSGQMQEYMSMADAEESQLANAKSDLERRAAERINIKKYEEALEKDPSARYQLSRYHKKDEETDFDRLDANRCSGFLLYSYNKKGAHSVLGERLSFAGYDVVGKGGRAWI